MISDDEISHRPTMGPVGSSHFISALTLLERGGLGGLVGLVGWWWVVGLPSFPYTQPSPGQPSPPHLFLFLHLPLTCMWLNQTKVILSFAFMTHIPMHVLGVLSRVDALCVPKIAMT